MLIFKIAIIGSIIASVAFFIYDYRSTKSDNKSLTAETEQLRVDIESIEQEVRKQQSMIRSLDQRNQIIEQDLVDRVNSINELRNIVLNSQEDVLSTEQRINEIINQLHEQMSCISGNFSACSQ